MGCVSPAGDSLFFVAQRKVSKRITFLCCPKKSKQKKGHPLSPPRYARFPRFSASTGVGHIRHPGSVCPQSAIHGRLTPAPALNHGGYRRGRLTARCCATLRYNSRSHLQCLGGISCRINEKPHQNLCSGGVLNRLIKTMGQQCCPRALCRCANASDQRPRFFQGQDCAYRQLGSGYRS